MATPVSPGAFGAPTYWTVVPVAGGASRQIQVSNALAASQLKSVYLNAWPSADRGIVAVAGTASSSLSPHNLWLVRMRPGTWTVDSAPQPLTFGSDNNDSAHALPDGRVAFVTRSDRLDLWQLPVRLDEGVPTGDIKRLTESRDRELEPALTPDGRHVLYTAARRDNLGIVVRDVESGAERAVAASPDFEMWPRVSPDGRLVGHYGEP